MGVTHELAPVATAETVVPHHAIHATGTAFPYKELLTGHFIAGGVMR